MRTLVRRSEAKKGHSFAVGAKHWAWRAHQSLPLRHFVANKLDGRAEMRTLVRRSEAKKGHRVIFAHGTHGIHEKGEPSAGCFLAH
jgi:hypothetical protein